MKKKRIPRVHRDIVATKLVELSGNVSAVARSLGVTRQAVQKVIKKYSDLREILDECRETLIDNVESAVYKNALDGNVPAGIFILKTLGRDRGYTEKEESRVNVNIVNNPVTEAIIKVYGSDDDE